MLTHKGTETIRTERLTLRRFALDDAESMFKHWANDPEVTRFLTWKPHGDIGVSKSVVQQWVSEYKIESFYNWAIELKELGEPIGGISVVNLDEANESCEIGYCISRAYWRNGITPEALKAVIDFLFSEVGINRIAARHDTKNPASGRVMQKSGMLYEGTHRQEKLRDGKTFCDMAVYAILKEDWRDRQ